MNLSDIVQTAAAIRLRQRLLPEGGPGDKVFPPTFAGGVYCWETRRIEGSAVPCVLLDSVASQANRLEEALAEAVDRNLIDLPRLVVQFDGGLANVGKISTLAAPHRVFDAIFRDSTLDGKPFFKSPLYLKLTACNVRNATDLFAYAPTALLFGCWDSTGAAGGLGNKFARAVTSEIVGINAEWGATRGGIRQDPLNISSDVEISIDDSGDWSVVGRSKGGKKDRAKGTRPYRSGSTFTSQPRSVRLSAANSRGLIEASRCR
jgi:CRISPR-associated protein Csb1